MVIPFVIDPQESQDLAVNMAALLDECLTRGSNDNMSGLLVQFRDGTDYSQEWYETPFVLVFSQPSDFEYIPGPYHDGERHASFQKAYNEDAEVLSIF